MTSLSTYLDQIVDRYHHYKKEGRFFIGIVGAPGAGKSYLADRIPGQINERLENEVATSLAMDSYHLHNDILLTRGIHPHKGCYFTFDVKGFTSKLIQVKEDQEDILCPIYNRSLHNPTPDAKTIKKSDRIVVVEGNYLLLDVFPWQTIKYLFDYTIFIEVDKQIQYERLLDRHTTTGKTKDEAIAKISRTDLPNATLIEATKNRADFIYRPAANFPR